MLSMNLSELRIQRRDSRCESHKMRYERGNQRLVVRVGVGEGDIYTLCESSGESDR